MGLRRRLVRLAALASWLGLPALPLVPGLAAGVGGVAGHVAAYALSGFLTRASGFRVRSRWELAALSLVAALVGIGQAWAGRAAGFDLWVAATFGALIGLAPARAIAHRRHRARMARRALETAQAYSADPAAIGQVSDRR